MDNKVKEHEKMLTDPNNSNFIMNNDNLVCNCIGECTCKKRKFTTTHRLNITNDNLKKL